MLRKSKDELEKELQDSRPQPRTKINPIEIEYCIGTRRKETFTDKETLLWALSFQNPSCIRQINAKYPFLIITGSGKQVTVEIKDL